MNINSINSAITQGKNAVTMANKTMGALKGIASGDLGSVIAGPLTNALGNTGLGKALGSVSAALSSANSLMNKASAMANKMANIEGTLKNIAENAFASVVESLPKLQAKVPINLLGLPAPEVPPPTVVIDQATGLLTSVAPTNPTGENGNGTNPLSSVMGVANSLTSVASNLQNVATGAITSVTTNIQNASGMLSVIAPSSGLSDVLAQTNKVAGQLQSQVNNITGAINSVNSAIGSVSSTINSVGKQLDSLKNVSSVGDLVGSLSSTINGLSGTLSALGAGSSVIKLATIATDTNKTIDVVMSQSTKMLGNEKIPVPKFGNTKTEEALKQEAEKKSEKDALQQKYEQVNDELQYVVSKMNEYSRMLDSISLTTDPTTFNRYQALYDAESKKAWSLVAQKDSLKEQYLATA